MIKDRTWVEIDQGKILYNFHQFRMIVPPSVKIGAVIKSNAYGHGLVEIANILKDEADYFFVDSYSEACIVRKYTQKPIVILGYIVEGDMEAVIKSGFELTVFNKESLDFISKISKKLKLKVFLHLEIETGTARNGIKLSEIGEYLSTIKNNLVLSGVFTHFANIEDTTSFAYAKNQLALYEQALNKIRRHKYTKFKKHTACSAAAILFNQTHYDVIRLGLSLYGLWPSKETKVSALNRKIGLGLKPALTWKTRIAHIKTLPKGAYVGYGCTEKLMRNSKIAVIPVGYYDGFDRGLSSVGEVLVNGVRCRVVGRVCMNMTMVDVTNLKKVKINDEVVLVGVQGAEEISCEIVATKLQTINYEVVTRINPLIKRIVI